MKILPSLAMVLAVVLTIVAFGSSSGAAQASFTQLSLSHTAVSNTPAGSSRFGLSLGSQIQYQNSALQARQLDDMRATGAGWVRVDLKWNEVQIGGAGSYDWDRYDRVISGVVNRGMQVLAVVVGAPPWARNPACAGSGDTCAPTDPSLFGTFMKKATAHYAPMGVKSWELWNEPNLSTFWKPAPNPAKYTALLKAGYLGVKSADSAAIVVSAGLASVGTDGSGNQSPTDFLRAMYAAGARGSFDALGDHPYCWAQAVCPTGSTQVDSGGGWSMMADTPTSLRSLMSANGDSGKRIWATEFGAPTGGGSLAKSEAAQSAMLTRAYQLFGSYSWAGPMFWYSYTDAGTDGSDTEDWFGLTRHDESYKPARAAFVSAANAAAAAPGTVTVNVTVRASDPTRVASLKVCVRDSSGGNRDYFVGQDAVLITKNGRAFTATARFASGTYTYFGCIRQHDGSWWSGGPAQTFTVKA